MEQTERVYRGWDGIGLRHPEPGPLRYSAPSATGRPPCDRSGRAPVEDYAIGHRVADMVAVLDTLGEERSHVIGHDWGAVVAWALTAGLNWYRANLAPHLELEPRAPLPSVTAPTLGLWSDRDKYLIEEGMLRSAECVSGTWRYERIRVPATGCNSTSLS
jgi:hypothetical protein